MGRVQFTHDAKTATPLELTEAGISNVKYVGETVNVDGKKKGKERKGKGLGDAEKFKLRGLRLAGNADGATEQLPRWLHCEFTLLNRPR